MIDRFQAVAPVDQHEHPRERRAAAQEVVHHHRPAGDLLLRRGRVAIARHVDEAHPGLGLILAQGEEVQLLRPARRVRGTRRVSCGWSARSAARTCRHWTAQRRRSPAGPEGGKLSAFAAAQMNWQSAANRRRPASMEVRGFVDAHEASPGALFAWRDRSCLRLPPRGSSNRAC